MRHFSDPAWQAFDRVKEFSIAMTRIESVTGSEGEANFADAVLPLIRTIPHFEANPDHVVILDSHGEPKRRNIVLCVPGRGDRALLMAGHYDTVSLDNYRDLKGLATDPEALLPALVTDLSGRALNAAETKAREDFAGGDFLPGRGLLDMKAGLAAGLAVLERFANDPDRVGTLMLAMTPDEEGGSAGARALAHDLPAIAARFGVTIAAAINLDATSDQGDGAEGRAAYLGSIGKTMPFAYVAGRAAHAAYPYEGFSASLLAARILSAIEANPDLADRAGAEPCPPPVCLEIKDNRALYDVTMPDRVFMGFNWLSFSFGADAVLNRFNAIVERESIACSKAYAEAARQHGLQGSSPVAVRMIPVEALVAEAEAREGAGFAARHAALAAKAQALQSPLAATRLMVEGLVDMAAPEGPYVVTGLAGLHYPPVRLDPAQPDDRALLAAVEAGRAVVPGHPVSLRDCFMGISDMSFIGHVPAAGAGAALAGATPAPHLLARIPAHALSFPIVNIGPWGREYHQRLERIHMPYGFAALPVILTATISAFLSP